MTVLSDRDTVTIFKEQLRELYGNDPAIARLSNMEEVARYAIGGALTDLRARLEAVEAKVAQL